MTWLSPAMPTAVTGPRPPGTETISVLERDGICPHGLASYPRDPRKISPPLPSSETPHPVGPALPLHLHKLSHNWKVPQP